MSTSLRDFIRLGQLGGLRLGLTRSEIISGVGLPENWSGKPPTFGPLALTPEEADMWFYYNDAAGIRFNEHDVSVSFVIDPSKIDRSIYPFLNWPFRNVVRMSDFREWLIENRISFLVESLGDECYMLAMGHCLVTCFPFERGQLVAMRLRKIMLIETVASVDCLPDFCKR